MLYLQDGGALLRQVDAAALVAEADAAARVSGATVYVVRPPASVSLDTLGLRTYDGRALR